MVMATAETYEDALRLICSSAALSEDECPSSIFVRLYSFTFGPKKQGSSKVSLEGHAKTTIEGYGESEQGRLAAYLRAFDAGCKGQCKGKQWILRKLDGFPVQWTSPDPTSGSSEEGTPDRSSALE